MFKTIFYLSATALLLSLSACSSGSSSPEPEPDKTITSFDQAQLSATLSYSRDSSGYITKSVFVRFGDQDLIPRMISNGSVLFNDSALTHTPTQNNAYIVSNGRVEFATDLNDTLQVSINSTVKKTEFTRPANYDLYSAGASQSTDGVFVYWQPVTAAAGYTDRMEILFTNIISKKTYTHQATPTELSNGSVDLPLENFAQLIDSTGYGLISPTFTHKRVLQFSTPYRTGSIFTGNFVRVKRAFRIE